VKSIKRDFERGDSYDYYLDHHLKSAGYDAYNVDLDSPWDRQNVTTSLTWKREPDQPDEYSKHELWFRRERSEPMMKVNACLTLTGPL
jgi:hypothetical protein